MFKTYLPIDYICIDLANCYGLDKLLFEDRIKWVKDNFNYLEDFIEAAENKPQYIKALHALRETMLGNPTGHLIGLDASCSGIQLMSVMTGCIKGADATGLVSQKRADAYTDVTTEMNSILKLKGLSSIEVKRDDIKRCVMTAGYGSTLVPKEVFGEDDLLTTFYQAASAVAKGAFELMPALLDSWQKNALSHNWVMPDNFHVNIKVMQTKETRIEVDELDHATFTTYVKINKGSEKGLANVANLTHSVDSYVLRSLVRRASFDVEKVKQASIWIEEELDARMEGQPKYEAVMTPELQNMLNIYEYSKMLDVSIIDYFDKHTVELLPNELLLKLGITLDKMLELGSSPVLTVHDAYFSHANHCNAVRYWYKEILAELAESTILDFLVSQIVGEEVKWNKPVNNLAELIRNSNYGLC